MNVPNHGKKAFRDMTPEEMGAIAEAIIAGEIEYWSAFSRKWMTPGRAMGGLDFEAIYRTCPHQLVIPWEHVKPECKFAALQGTGEVWFYEIEPELRADKRGAWWFGKGANCWESVLVIDTSGIDPEHSLTARPKGV